MPAYALTWYTIEIEITTPVDQTKGSCIVESTCGSCATATACSDLQTTMQENMFSDHNLTRYGAAIEYQCAPGQTFNNGSALVQTILLGCNTAAGSQSLTSLPVCESMYITLIRIIIY